MGGSKSEARQPELRQSSYEALADFRREVRRFFDFSKNAIEKAGIAPVQYQAMLAIKAHRAEAMSVTELAEELFIKVHTAGELVGRMQEGQLVSRTRSPDDHRRMMLVLTARGEQLLAELAALHLQQHSVSLPSFVKILSEIATLIENEAAEEV